MTTIVKDSTSASSATGAYLLSGAATAIQLKALETQDKETPHRKTKLMPTGGTAKLASDPTAELPPEIRNVIDKMTPEQRKAFVDALIKFQADVEKLKAVLLSMKNANAPTPEETETLIKAAQVVGNDAKGVLSPVKSVKSSDPKEETSIWFLLQEFMVNDIMGMNNLEMSAAMKQVQAQSNNITNVAAGLSKMNADIAKVKSPDVTSNCIFSIGVFLAGLILAPFTGGASLAAGIAIAIAFPVCNAQDVGSDAAGRFGGLSDFMTNTTLDTTQLTTAQNTQQGWSLIGTNSNQQLSTTMQLHVQQTSQVNVQAAQQFSTMINYASQTMSTGRGG
jgi:hypothetical protein